MEYTRDACAKLNLCLSVLGRRADGYHEVDMLMAAVSLRDTLTFKRAQGLTLDIQGGGALPVEDNLVMRAARLLGEHRPFPGAHITLIKRVPEAAGMGGGSSDAAVTLAALNDMYALGFTAAQLEAQGARLGADVPFFIRGGLARATGTGTHLERLPCDTRCAVAVATPRALLSTPEVYRLYDAQPTPPRDMSAAKEALRTGNLRALRGTLFNALEEAALTLCPDIARLKRHFMERGAIEALMTGSGPTVFALYERERDALEAVDALDIGVRFKDVCALG